ncbi:MAG: 50S ribosome-binding GTPase [Planctomycetes bacterium]|nr:50S ribosome-binding GTPase [Planctomycetota bacterium]
MCINNVTHYIYMSSENTGAIGIFHAYGNEENLAALLDAKVGGKKTLKTGNKLQIKELRYGWLLGNRNSPIDEVMLAKPVDGMRVLMTHGGTAVRQAVKAFFHTAGCAEFTWNHPEPAARWQELDPLLDRILAGCLTEVQAAAVLEARAAAEKDGGEPRLPENLLLTHRLMLAGPPNVGKSSLMNRLAGFERAFVNSCPGATLDVVDELVDLAGFAVWLGDLPGFAAGGGELDRAAWRKAAERLSLAEAVLFVCDGSRPWLGEADLAAREVAAVLAGGKERPVLVVLNKSDLPPGMTGDPWRKYFPRAKAICVCSLPGGDAAVKLGEAALPLLARE